MPVKIESVVVVVLGAWRDDRRPIVPADEVQVEIIRVYETSEWIVLS